MKNDMLANLLFSFQYSQPTNSIEIDYSQKAIIAVNKNIFIAYEVVLTKPNTLRIFLFNMNYEIFTKEDMLVNLDNLYTNGTTIDISLLSSKDNTVEITETISDNTSKKYIEMIPTESSEHSTNSYTLVELKEINRILDFRLKSIRTHISLLNDILADTSYHIVVDISLLNEKLDIANRYRQQLQFFSLNILPVLIADYYTN